MKGVPLTAEQVAARWRFIAECRADKLSIEAMAKRLRLHTDALVLWMDRNVQTRTTQRACLRCRKEFASEGPHHRMCGDCRGMSVSPMTPDPGGSTGRRALSRHGE